MDSAGSRSATIFGHSEGGNVSLLFAATHPDRTDRLILTGSYAKRIRSDDYPWAPTMEEREAEVAAIEAHWGSLLDVSHYAPSRADDLAFIDWLAAIRGCRRRPGSGDPSAVEQPHRHHADPAHDPGSHVVAVQGGATRTCRWRRGSTSSRERHRS